MEMQAVKELILQSLEHEMGGVKIYETALKCVQNEDLKEEWEKYHQQTERHVQILQDVCSQMELDAEEQTPGRSIVHDMGASLVAAMEAALGAGDQAMAERVACECVVLAESTDHSNWQLIGQVANTRRELQPDEVEQTEDQFGVYMDVPGPGSCTLPRTYVRERGGGICGFNDASRTGASRSPR